MNMKQAVVILVDDAPYVTEIPDTDELAVLQSLVGGYIEVVPMDRPVSVFCNEEGKIKGLPINYRADHVLGIPNDVLVGTVVVLGEVDEDGETTSLGDLTEPLLERLTEITDVDVARYRDWRALRARREKATTRSEHAALDREEEALRQRGVK